MGREEGELEMCKEGGKGKRVRRGVKGRKKGEMRMMGREGGEGEEDARKKGRG